MSFNTWTPPAVFSEAFAWTGRAWRMVEAQHVASTMKLVDTRDEQDLLESLLEASKPPRPRQAQHLHDLLATPYRYDPLRDGSRFRAATDAGVFYGAECVRTAAAELGFWRWRFLRDAAALERLEPVAHTAFSAAIDTTVIDLRRSPFDVDRELWAHPRDYAPTQAFARVAREAKLGGILYGSVRDPNPAWCLALLTPAGFARPKPSLDPHPWFLTVTRQEVTWRRDAESLCFSAAGW